MRRAIPICFNYAAKFRCIGAACDDTCCGQWTIPINRKAFEKYQKIPPGSLRALLHKSLTLTGANEVAVSDHCSPAGYAKIRLDDAHQCPLLSNDHLCRIQAECGSDFLSHTYSTYPRIVQRIGPAEETALTLSCPEAARFFRNGPLVAPQTATRSPLPASPYTGGAMETDRPSAPSPHEPRAQD